jgi:dethiobiotin synthetase
MNGYFITGTDTGVGKTLVSAVLTLALQGYYWKPVQSGVATDVTDQDFVQQITGLPDKHFFPSIYRLQAPLSPNQAAVLENVSIDIKSCQLENPAYPLIVEGVGGILVPINNTHAVIDLAQQTALPVIIVSRGTLGTLNHTLLTIRALQQKNIPIQGVIFSGELFPTNQADIEKWSGIKTLFHLPHLKNLSKSILQFWVNENRNKILEGLT